MIETLSILDEARELLIRALYSVQDTDLHDEIEIWLQNYWSKYGKDAPRNSKRRGSSGTGK